MWASASITDVSEEVSSVITDAAIGRRCWSDLCKLFTQAFPGSYAALLNQNFVRPEVNFAVSDGLEEEHINSFLGHYSLVNPWQRFWQHASNGAILVAERDDPARQYRGSEFYEDWMKAVGDFDAAVGLRLQVEDDQIIYLPVHFSEKLSPAYEPRLEAVMRNTRRSLTNALQLASYVQDTAQKVSAEAALAGLDHHIVFVVDENLKLHEANQRAVDAFSCRFPVTCRNGMIRFAVPSVTSQVLQRLRSKQRDLVGKLLMTAGVDKWVVGLNSLPRLCPEGPILSRPQFLIQIHKLSSSLERIDEDLLVAGFGLTPSELRLCRALAAGVLLADAAPLVQISYENARQKLKSIFKKLSVSSQADLKMVLRSMV
nr:hypothetical protein [Pseudorhizobium flavum]CAD6632137.1 helix-turn-helix transcriptional regulator [Pseudorhizobium flavum]